MKLNPENAKNLQASLRAYKASMARLESATEEGQVVTAAEGYLDAKRNFKGAVERCETQLRKDAEERFTPEQRELLAKAKGEGGYSFVERVEAYLQFEPDATASDVAGATGISLQEVMGIFEQRKAD